MLLRFCVAFFVLWVHAAVAGDSSRTEEKTAISIESRVSMLESQLDSLESRVPSRVATLDCNTKKFSEFILNPGSLVLFAACENIESYLEGHRVTIKVGNPHSFNFSQVSGDLRYGKTLIKVFSNSAIEIPVIGEVRAGTWSIVSVIINPSSAEMMRHMLLRMEAASVTAAQ